MTNRDLNTNNKAGSRARFGAAQLRLLERLCTACAVSGDEGEVRLIVLEQVQGHVRSKGGEVKVDFLETCWSACRAPARKVYAHA